MRERIADVFKTIGRPTYTYVERDSGNLEKALSAALNEKGQLCLITGPSKTGKTTLYTKVLSTRKQIPLIVRCDRTLRTDDIWLKALEEIDFERVEARQDIDKASASIEGEASAKLSWPWLANVSTRLKGSIGAEASDTETRKRILATPGPDLLIPVLKNTNYVLVIEDFHYLEDKEKVQLFQQWKRFTDNEVSVIVLGTTHRAVDIASSNRDLVGRVSQIDVGHWAQSDLELICRKGFSHLKINASAEEIRFIASEAVGLPIVVQQACLALFRNIEYVDEIRPRRFNFTRIDIERALHTVASQKYKIFEPHYSTLIRGPREKSRKYKTYELILACFTLNPIKFSLHRREIDERLRRLNISPEEIPPFASLNSTLGALKKFQNKRNFELLEWQQNEDVLYIIEPVFLFFVRWRAVKESVQLDLFEKLILNTWSTKLYIPITPAKEADAPNN